MSRPFVRRPILRGNTSVPVQTRPYIRGQVKRNDADLQFTGFSLPATMQVDLDGTVKNVVLGPGLTINDIINTLNTAFGLDGSAEDREGYIHLESSNVGEGAYIEIQDSGANDAAKVLGFPVAPDPLSRFEAGDLAYSPPGGAEDNPLGSAYAAGGEDVTSEVLNRAVDALAYNQDQQDLCLNREMAFPMILEVDPTDPVWAARLITSSGKYVQLNVGGLSAISPLLSDRAYLGQGLDKNSTLSEIADYFAVIDTRRVEIIVDGRAVRVAAVHHGQRTAATPNFVDEVTPPATPLPNVGNWTALDGRNLLGVDFVKVPAVGIDEVLYRTAVASTGETFITKGVSVGDKAVIAASTNDEPFNHNGEYRVEQAISEELLLLRGAQSGDRGELNPSLIGSFGTVQLSSGGEFAEDVWVTFEPGIPTGTSFLLVLGGAFSLCDLPIDHLLRLAISTSEEVDDLVQKVIREMKGPLVDSTDDFTADPFAHSIVGGNTYAGESDVSMELLWRRITLQSAYDGQGRAGGGGYFAQVDANPPEWNNMTPPTPLAGTALRVGTGGTFLSGNVFNAVGEAFTLDDVGRQIVVTTAGGPLRQYQAFVIIDYLDSENVLVEPGENNPVVPLGGNYGYSVFQDKFDGLPAAHTSHVLQVPGLGRLGYVAEEDRVEGSPFGHGFMALREVTTHPSSTPLDVFDITLAGGDNLVSIGFDPSLSSNLRALVSPDPAYSQNFIKLTETGGPDGWYRVIQLDVAGQRLGVENLDGTLPVFPASTTGRGHLYLPAQGMFESSIGGLRVRVGNTFFEDAVEWGAATSGLSTHLGVVGVDWRGASNGLMMALNSSTWNAYQNGDAASGIGVNVLSYMPANSFYGGHLGVSASDAAFVAVPDVAERGGFASLFAASTYSMDLTQADPGLRGFASWIAQTGKDPALVLTCFEGAAFVEEGGLPETYTKLLGKPALLGAQESDWSMLQSAFAQIRGGLYQEDGRLWDPVPGTQLRGGIYTELSAAVRRTLAPMGADDVRYYETSFNGDMPFTARLGQPGRMFPPFQWQAATFPVGNILAPDYSRSRSVRSSGFIQWFQWLGRADLDTAEPSALIGQQITLSGCVNAGNNGTYTIINVRPRTLLGNQVHEVEVYNSGITLIAEVGTPAEAVILGSRWHYANLDIESFMMMGTYKAWDHQFTDPEYFKQLGVFGTSDELTKDLTDRDSNGSNQGGLLHSLPWGTSDYASGQGWGPLLNVLPATIDAARPPIANEGWHSEAEPLLPADLPNLNFDNSEYVFRLPGAHNLTSITTDFDDPDNGYSTGAILLYWATPATDAFDSVLAFVRTTKQIRTHHFRVKVTLVVRPIGGTGNKVLLVDLVDDIDANTSITGNGPVAVTAAYGATSDLEVTLECAGDLRESPKDAFSTQPTSAILKLSLGDTDTGAAEKLFIYRVHVEIEAKDVHHGTLINEGPVLATGFHLSGAAMDYRAYGPECAGPFGGAGYGDEWAWGAGGENYQHPLDDGKLDPPVMPWLEGMQLKEGAAQNAVWDDAANFLDVAPASWFWHRGAHDACFSFFGRKYTPKKIVANTEKFPGMVGHIVSLDLPHGALLSHLWLGMSILPATSLVAPFQWGVFNETECDGNDTIPAVEGYVVELRRYSAMPLEDIMLRENGTGAGVETPFTAASFGFSEVLLREKVDLTDKDPLATTTLAREGLCAGGGDDQTVNDETFLSHKVDLSGLDPEMGHVDRRQYSYSLVIRAWGMGRQGVEPKWFLIDNLATAGHRFGVAGGLGAGTPNSYGYATQFKFRGCQVATRYTRINP